MPWSNIEMADEVIKFFKPHSSVNLGIGMPTIVAERILHELNIMIHSENGVLGVSGRPKKETVSPTLINAGKETIAIKKGASFFDSAMSFGMIRGGHIDYCVLGGMEVDAQRNLANWMVPGKKVTGMGGAMDLVNGSKQVIIMMNHFSKDGVAKLLPLCKLPFTGLDVVDLVVTEMGIFKPNGSQFEIIKLAEGVSVEDLKMEASILFQK
ncbi:MAG: 3-oxoacid CoA-transferase subunit B [Bacteriovorax sp.]